MFRHFLFSSNKLFNSLTTYTLSYTHTEDLCLHNYCSEKIYWWLSVYCNCLMGNFRYITRTKKRSYKRRGKTIHNYRENVEEFPTQPKWDTITCVCMFYVRWYRISFITKQYIFPLKFRFFPSIYSVYEFVFLAFFRYISNDLL